MVYVVIDTFQKHIVRDVWRIPEGMEFIAAERVIKRAYSEGDREEDAIVAELKAAGFVNESWLSCEI